MEIHNSIKKRLLLLILLFYSVSGFQNKTCIAVDINEGIEIPVQNQITISVKFHKSGGVILQYIDNLFRQNTIQFVNRYNRDTIIVRSVLANNKTIFRHTSMKNNIFCQVSSYLLETSDSLQLYFYDDSLINISSNLKLNAIEKIYGKKEYFKQKEFSKNNIQELFDSAEKTYLLAETKIKEFGGKENWPSQFQSGLLKYNLANKFLTIFRIDYDKIPYSVLMSSKLKYYYLQFIREKNIFDDLNFMEQRIILYYTTKYISKIKKKGSSDVLKNLKNIDASFYKKQYIDGYIYDLLLLPENSSLSIKKILDEFADIIFDKNSFHLHNKLSKESLPENILNTPLIDLGNSSLNLRDIIKTKKSLIVIDFWATWCLPCISEFPKLKEVINKYSESIEFISISIDEDSTKWHNGSKKNNIIKNSYRNVLGKNSPLVNFLELYNIPRYAILDNKGNILVNDFYRPSDPKFNMELENILVSQKEND